MNAPEIFLGFIFDRRLPNFCNKTMNDMNKREEEYDTIRSVVGQ